MTWDSFTYPFIPHNPPSPQEHQLFVCGRSKDLIIIHGKNHYPQDIEYSCHAVKEVKQGSVAAFDVRVCWACERQVKTKTEEELVVVLELKEGKRSDDEYARITHELTRVISADNGLIPAVVVIVAPKTIPKTTSGKISRSRVRAEYAKGQLSVVYEARNAVGDEAVKAEAEQEEGVAVGMNALEIEGGEADENKGPSATTDRPSQAPQSAQSASQSLSQSLQSASQSLQSPSQSPEGAEMETPEVLLPSQMDGLDTVGENRGGEG